MLNSNFTKLSAIAGLTSLTLLALPARAVQVVYESTTYEVSTIEGTYNDFEDEITASPWWNDLSAAEFFAEEVALDLPGVASDIGPYFPYQLVGGIISTRVWVDSPSFTGVSGFSATTDFPTIYAVAEPIPEPITILGSVVALGFGAAIKRQFSQKS